MAINIDLIVQEYSTKKPPTGFKQCTDKSNNAVSGFCYQYVGGNWLTKGPGSFEATLPTNPSIPAPIIINVTLVATSIWQPIDASYGFRIANMAYEPANGELSPSVVSADFCQIKDHVSLAVPAAENATYSIIVAHKSSSGTVTPGLYCHPGWRNGGGGGGSGRKKAKKKAKTKANRKSTRAKKR